ncbi:hypothetical protein [Zhongshania aquimaris]|uniref:NADH:quinone oxidoreductase/Mrp antiporter membrane subunit domain-containing protein n=1 Tax=Zhongshania aquimaris TaxID=2857107 RepID=A0ABS6VTR4_9GAMM|nr:hypothetical protein [Zhongshania aquimaris]MBW2941715.1 hypothetical protein [Zhongshania aquimaris]
MINSSSYLLALLLGYLLMSIAVGRRGYVINAKCQVSTIWLPAVLHGLMLAMLTVLFRAEYKLAIIAATSMFAFYAVLNIGLSKFSCSLSALAVLLLKHGMQVVIIVCVFLSVDKLWPSLPGYFMAQLTAHNLAVLLAYFLVLRPASVIIGHIMYPWQQKLSGEDDTLVNGGAFIGYLERGLTLTFVLISQWHAIGFLLTAKSILRFNELKGSHHPQRSEYVLLGTLLSFSLSIGVGLAVYLLDVSNS